MIASVIVKLRDMCSIAIPGALFECDEASMMNVKIDTVTRDKSVIYVEEPTQGNILLPYGGFQTQRTAIRIFFIRFEPMHNDAMRGDLPWSNSGDVITTLKRLDIRDSIEQEMLIPFLKTMRKEPMFMAYPLTFETMRVLYPRSRFDANEVSVGLEFTYIENLCL